MGKLQLRSLLLAPEPRLRLEDMNLELDSLQLDPGLEKLIMWFLVLLGKQPKLLPLHPDPELDREDMEWAL